MFFAAYKARIDLIGFVPGITPADLPNEFLPGLLNQAQAAIYA